VTDHLRLDLRLLPGKLDEDHVAELKPLSVDLDRHELEYRATLSALRNVVSLGRQRPRDTPCATVELPPFSLID
jgi:hypothetical protein